jgi:hypothetical protein
MLYLLMDMALTLITIIAFGALLRMLARFEFYWIVAPANTFAVVVTDEKDAADADPDEKNAEGIKKDDIGGGSVITVLHAIDGRVIAKKKQDSDEEDPDSMNWKFEEGEEQRDVLFELLGIQRKGLYWKLRKNRIHRLRYKPNDSRDEKIVVKFIHFTGDERIIVDGVETTGNLRLRFEFNFIYERRYPIRSVLRISDSYAYLTSMTQESVIRIAGTKKPEDYMGGENSAKAKEELVGFLLNELRKPVLDELGIYIHKIALHVVSADANTVKYLEMEEKARREAKAAIIEAEGAKQVKMLSNEAEADYVERVIKEMANTPGADRIRAAIAYENNETVTTLNVGGNGLGLIVDPRTPEKKTKEQVGFKPKETEVPTTTEPK